MKPLSAIIYIIFGWQVVNAQSIYDTLTFNVKNIVEPKVQAVMVNNGLDGSTPKTSGIYDSALNSNLKNGASAVKTQQIGLDLQGESQAILNDPALPSGCGNTSSMSNYQKDLCTAASALNAMSMEVINSKSEYSDVADASYKTMEDTSAVPLSSSLTSFYSSTSNGLPVPGNLIYDQNKQSINSFQQALNSYNKNGEYRGIKYSPQNDIFYLNGKKYSGQVLKSKEEMEKAGIDPMISNFLFSMLKKKSTGLDAKIADLMKKNGLFDKANRDLASEKNKSQSSELIDEESNENLYDNQSKNQSSKVNKRVFLNKKPDVTLYKSLNGLSVGLAHDDIFKIISRKYRDLKERDFFHGSYSK